MDRHARIKRRLRLRDLDTLLVVAQCGSMARAASQLSISQPAISKAIADMEYTIGVKLLDRTSQGVQPTPYGRALLKSGAAVFDDLRQGMSEIETLADPTAGELRITTSEPLAAGVLPVIIAQLTERYPRISMYVRQTPIGSVVAPHPPYRDLHERDVDLIFGPIVRPWADDGLDVELLLDERLVVAVGAQNRWLRRRAITLADLIDEPWVLPPRDTVAGARHIEAFRLSKLAPPKRIFECNSLQLQNGLLANQQFLTMYPSSLMQFGAKRYSIKALPIALPVRPPPVGIITLKNRTISPAAQLFIACAREVAKPLANGKARPDKTKR